jgi:hypothetical protein
MNPCEYFKDQGQAFRELTPSGKNISSICRNRNKHNHLISVNQRDGNQGYAGRADLPGSIYIVIAINSWSLQSLRRFQFGKIRYQI